MNVRAATPADTRAIARVHSDSSDAAYAHVVAPDPDGYERRLGIWHSILGSDAASFVAEDDGEIVGILTVSGSELRVLYVLPASWGSGAGQLLIDRAHELLEATGDDAVLTVLADNPRARRFYERNGWTLSELVTEPHFGGIPTEIARYRKTFASSSRSR